MILRTVLITILLGAFLEPVVGNEADGSVGDNVDGGGIFKEWGLPSGEVDQEDEGVKVGDGVGVGVGEDEVEMSMPEAIFIALRDNEDLESAYINRITQRFSLKTAEHVYNPQGSVTIGGSVADTYNRDRSYNRKWTLTGPNLSLTQKIKTGGTFTFAWNGNGESVTNNTTKDGEYTSRSSASGANVSLGYSQPLLKGAGYDVATLGLTRAYFTEEGNVLTLKKTVINKINEIIKKYRSYVTAIESYKIDKAGIERAQQTFEQNKLLVEAGERSPSQLTQDEANLASRYVTFESQTDTKDNERVELLRLLNVDRDTQIIPDKELDVDLDYLPTIEECLDIAFVNDTDYLKQLISMREAELTLMDARNNLLWDLRLSARVNASGKTSSSMARANETAWNLKEKGWNVGLDLTIPINDIGRESTLLSAKTGLRSAKISLKKKEEDMATQIKSRLRTIKSKIKQVEFAKVRTKLSQKKYEEAKIQHDAGETTSFQLISFADDVTTAEKDELNAKINLLNSLTDLDSDLGTTLSTWKVDVNRRSSRLPEYDNKFHTPYAHNGNGGGR